MILQWKIPWSESLERCSLGAVESILRFDLGDDQHFSLLPEKPSLQVDTLNCSMLRGSLTMYRACLAVLFPFSSFSPSLSTHFCFFIVKLRECIEHLGIGTRVMWTDIVITIIILLIKRFSNVEVNDVFLILSDDRLRVYRSFENFVLKMQAVSRHRQRMHWSLVFCDRKRLCKRK